MKVLSVAKLSLPEVKVIRFARFCDERGYFTEHFRPSDLSGFPELHDLTSAPIAQCNEAFSHAGTLRGFHVQWQPRMGKLVRPISGRLVDFALDLRAGSPDFGKVVGYDLPTVRERDFAEWIWIPPGFAHCTLLPEETLIEYFCTAAWNPECEASISPLSPDLDFSLCEPTLRTLYADCLCQGPVLSAKDRAAVSLSEWKKDPRASLVE